MKKAGSLIATTFVLALSVPASAFAIQVNQTTDQADATPDNGICDVVLPMGDTAGDCTLRAAIQTAQGTGNPGADTIDFALTLPATINLTPLTELPIIDEQLTITGPGASQLTVDGQSVVDWIFNVNATAATSVQISGLTITGGDESGGSVAQASGVRNQSGTVLLDQVVVTDNVAQSGALNAVTQGGGIYNTGTMVISQSTVSSNGGGAAGGDNGAPAGASSITRGGGIYNETGASESMLIERSTLSGNHADATIVDGTGTSATARGGGVHNVSGSTLTLDRVTVSGNTAATFIGGGADGPSTARGGGVDDDNVTVGALIKSSTITANTSSATSNGVGPLNPSGANLKPTAVTAIHNTIISLPFGATSCETTAGVSAYSIESPGNTCGLGGTGDQVSVADAALKLDPTLAANGGPTLTHKLLPGSPALDKGKAQGETTDQRSRPRPSQFTIMDASGGDGSDVGAYEVRAPLPTFTSIDPGTGGSDDTPTLRGSVTDDGNNPSAADVALFTDAGCTALSAASAPEAVFESPGITAGPVAHNATTTFYANGENAYGTSGCGLLTSYTHQDAPVITPPVIAGTAPATATPASTAKKKCKKGRKLKRGRCVKRKKR